MLLKLLCLLAVILGPSSAFNPEPDYFKYFIKTLGSLNPNTSTVNYINGTVFGKQPGKPLQQLFLFEGYNINRKLQQSDGTYLSLSREFVVYRDPKSAEILRVWMNPWTSKPNEVFSVANDPVDGTLGPDSAASHLAVRNNYITFNSDVILEYPNALSPDKYPKYSAGPVYDAAELFSFFASLTDLQSSADSVPAIGTWFRKSQYLPWMEMGATPGGLYYSTMSWKCVEGLSCVAPDIMQLVKQNHPEYQTAPSTEVDPNETSWTVFKKAVDKRRQSGLPDIIIPAVNASSNVSTKTNSIDSRVYNFFMNASFLSVQVHGQAYSEITGKQPYHLFDFRGYLSVDFEPLPTRDGYRIQLDGSVFFNSNGSTIKFWHNPITGKDCLVPNPFPVQVDMVFKNENFFTMDMESVKAVGLVAGQSSDDLSGGNPGNYSVNMANLFFPYTELAKTDQRLIYFYGNLATFSSWLPWMGMDGMPGNLVTKATVYK